MKILAFERERPGAADPDYAPHLAAEARSVWDLMQAGTIREIHFREDRSQTVIMLEAESTRQAEQVLAQLPLVKAGLIEFEVIGLRPYTGFARLFRD